MTSFYKQLLKKGVFRKKKTVYIYIYIYGG